jgi:hypothetical protein
VSQSTTIEITNEIQGELGTGNPGQLNSARDGLKALQNLGLSSEESGNHRENLIQEAERLAKKLQEIQQTRTGESRDRKEYEKFREDCDAFIKLLREEVIEIPSLPKPESPDMAKPAPLQQTQNESLVSQQSQAPVDQQGKPKKTNLLEVVVEVGRNVDAGGQLNKVGDSDDNARNAIDGAVNDNRAKAPSLLDNALKEAARKRGYSEPQKNPPQKPVADKSQSSNLLGWRYSQEDVTNILGKIKKLKEEHDKILGEIVGDQPNVNQQRRLVEIAAANAYNKALLAIVTNDDRTAVEDMSYQVAIVNDMIKNETAETRKGAYLFIRGIKDLNKPDMVKFAELPFEVQEEVMKSFEEAGLTTQAEVMKESLEKYKGKEKYKQEVEKNNLLKKVVALESLTPEEFCQFLYLYDLYRKEEIKKDSRNFKSVAEMAVEFGITLDQGEVDEILNDKGKTVPSSVANKKNIKSKDRDQIGENDELSEDNPILKAMERVVRLENLKNETPSLITQEPTAPAKTGASPGANGGSDPSQQTATAGVNDSGTGGNSEKSKPRTIAQIRASMRITPLVYSEATQNWIPQPTLPSGTNSQASPQVGTSQSSGANPQDVPVAPNGSSSSPSQSEVGSQDAPVAQQVDNVVVPDDGKSASAGSPPSLDPNQNDPVIPVKNDDDHVSQSPLVSGSGEGSSQQVGGVEPTAQTVEPLTQLSPTAVTDLQATDPASVGQGDITAGQGDITAGQSGITNEPAISPAPATDLTADPTAVPAVPQVVDTSGSALPLAPTQPPAPATAGQSGITNEPAISPAPTITPTINTTAVPAVPQVVDTSGSASPSAPTQPPASTNAGQGDTANEPDSPAGGARTVAGNLLAPDKPSATSSKHRKIVSREIEAGGKSGYYYYYEGTDERVDKRAHKNPLDDQGHHIHKKKEGSGPGIW